jgi:hypothetical protein
MMKWLLFYKVIEQTFDLQRISGGYYRDTDMKLAKENTNQAKSLLKKNWLHNSDCTGGINNDPTSI